MTKCEIKMAGYWSSSFFCKKNETNIQSFRQNKGRRGGLMVSALDSGASGSGLSPGWGHCVVFLGKTLYPHSASLHPGV